MENYNHFIGIDVGKRRLDIAIPVSNTGYHCIGANNDLEGFRKIVSELDKRKADLKKNKTNVNFWLVCEATGIYYIPLLEYFTSLGYKFTVVNPLSIKEFRKIMLEIIKDDKQDSKLIAEFGKREAERLGVTQAPSMEIRKMTQLQVLRKCLQQNIQRLSGVNENISFAKIEKNDVDTFLIKSVTDTKNQLLEVNKKLIANIVSLYPTEYKCMKSIPGVGDNLIIEVVLETDCLLNFKNLEQFKKYSGVIPDKHQSGTSVYKKSKLAQFANRNLRKALYMSSLSASQANKECKRLHDRLPENLLPKQKLMHVAKKLATQVWFCVRNKEVYKPESQRKAKTPPEQMQAKTQAAVEDFKYKNAELVSSFESEINL